MHGTMKNILFYPFFALLSFQAKAQIVFKEDFEKGLQTPIFQRTNYFEPPCNSNIVKTTAGIDCQSYLFKDEIDADVSGNGYFLFNGTPYTTAGQSYTGVFWGNKSAIDVEPYTYYEFSFYIANAFDINVAKIQPEINDYKLGEIQNTKGIGAFYWQKQTFCWYSQNTKKAFIKLNSLQDTPKGNDFGIDDIVLKKIKTSLPDTFSVNICDKTKYTFNGEDYTKSGFYPQILKKSNKECDSFFVLKLSFYKGSKTSKNITLCNGQTYSSGGKIYDKQGVFTEKYINSVGCDSIFELNIKVDEKIITSKNVAICENQTVKIGNKIYTKAGIYQDTLKSILGCDSVVILTIKAVDTVKLADAQTYNITDNQPVALNVVDEKDYKTFLWTPNSTLSCDRCPNPFAFPTSDTKYSLLAQNAQGCYFTVKVAVNVKVFCDGKVYLPNVFSPNDDGINDIFFVQSSTCIKKILVFRIFNRWGGLVFEQNDFSPNDPIYGWIGGFQYNTIFGSDVFTYYVEYEVNEQTKIVSGSCTIIK
jgi:gliding motility-associated-like protein